MLDTKGLGRKIDFFSETFHEKKSKIKQLNKDLLTKDEKFGEISEIGNLELKIWRHALLIEIWGRHDEGPPHSEPV